MYFNFVSAMKLLIYIVLQLSIDSTIFFIIFFNSLVVGPVFKKIM
jgi:hypothetical protein